jgi:hypothetical protein
MIDHVDQLGSLYLGAFHRRHSLLRSARIRAETHDTVDGQYMKGTAFK